MSSIPQQIVEAHEKDPDHRVTLNGKKPVILVVGGAGFIGSNFVRYMRYFHPDYVIIVLDRLSYGGRPENLEDVRANIEFVVGDARNRKLVKYLVSRADVVVNYAAESRRAGEGRRK